MCRKVFEVNSVLYDDNSFGEEELMARFSGQPIPEFFKAPLDEFDTHDEEDEDETPPQPRTVRPSVSIGGHIDEESPSPQPEQPISQINSPSTVEEAPTQDALPRQNPLCKRRLYPHLRDHCQPSKRTYTRGPPVTESRRSSRLQGVPQLYYGDTHRSARLC